eukprot:4769586-Amphidinium_carterae.1
MMKVAELCLKAGPMSALDMMGIGLIHVCHAGKDRETEISLLLQQSSHNIALTLDLQSSLLGLESGSYGREHKVVKCYLHV